MQKTYILKDNKIVEDENTSANACDVLLFVDPTTAEQQYLINEDISYSAGLQL